MTARRHRAIPHRQDVDGRWYCSCGRYFRLAIVRRKVLGEIRNRPERAAHGDVVPPEKVASR